MEGRGHDDVGTRYGDGFAALYGLVGPWFELVPDHVHWTSVLLSSLVAPMVYAIASALLNHRAGLLAAAVAAFMPVTVLMSPTETAFVAVASLQATAVWGVLRGGRAGDALFVFSSGLLAHFRPLQLVVVGVLMAFAWRHEGPQGGRKPAVIAACGLVVWRAVQLLGASSGDLNSRAMETQHLGQWLDVWSWFGQGSRIIVLDPWRTPLLVTALAAVALLPYRERPGSAGGQAAEPLGSKGVAAGLPVSWLPVALLVVGVLLYGHQPADADRLRFQLPTLVWVAVLAGIGGSRALSVFRLRVPLPTLVGVAILLLTPSFLTKPAYGHWVWQVEYAAVHDVVERIPAGGVVRYNDALDPQGAFYRWANQHSAGFWLPLDGPVLVGEWRWIGVADAYPSRADVDWDRFDSVIEWTPSREWGGIVERPPKIERMGLYEVRRSGGDAR